MAGGEKGGPVPRRYGPGCQGPGARVVRGWGRGGRAGQQGEGGKGDRRGTGGTRGEGLDGWPGWAGAGQGSHLPRKCWDLSPRLQWRVTGPRTRRPGLPKLWQCPEASGSLPRLLPPSTLSRIPRAGGHRPPLAKMLENAHFWGEVGRKRTPGVEVGREAGGSRGKMERRWQPLRCAGAILHSLAVTLGPSWSLSEPWSPTSR